MPRLHLIGLVVSLCLPAFAENAVREPIPTSVTLEAGSCLDASSNPVELYEGTAAVVNVPYDVNRVIVGDSSIIVSELVSYTNIWLRGEKVGSTTLLMRSREGAKNIYSCRIEVLPIGDLMGDRRLHEKICSSSGSTDALGLRVGGEVSFKTDAEFAEVSVSSRIVEPSVLSSTEVSFSGVSTGIATLVVLDVYGAPIVVCHIQVMP